MSVPANTLLPPTGNGVIDALTNGTHWVLDPQREVTWTVADAPGNDWKWSPQGATQVANATLGILGGFAEVANIRFYYSGWYDDLTAAPSDIVVAATARPEVYGMTQGTYARAFFPHEGWADAETTARYGSPHVYPNAAGDVLLNFANSQMLDSALVAGSLSYFALLHELGHAVGLKHPHDNGGNEFRPTFDLIGFSLADTQLLTIMSYETATDIARLLQQYNLPADNGYPSTLMPLDVMALQGIYGPNLTTRTGNDVYEVYADFAIETVWDAGGNDTVSARGSAFGWTIVAIELDFSDLVVAFPEEDDLRTGKFFFNIENIEGSPQDDLIIGNRLSNLIYGLGGNDVLAGGPGADLLDGGPGLDFAVYTGNRSGYQVVKDGIRATVSDRFGRDGVDSLFSVERLEFADLTLALDTGPGTNPHEASLLVRSLLGPAALRDRALMGLVVEVLDAGVDFFDLIDIAATSDLVTAAAGGTSDTAFVRQVYRSTIGFEPPKADLDYFVGLLTGGVLNRSELAFIAATSDFNLLSPEITGIVQGGLEYETFFG